MISSKKVLVAGAPQTHCFWKVLDELREFSTQRLEIQSGDELRAQLAQMDGELDLLVLSADVTPTAKLAQLVQDCAEMTHAEIVVVASQPDADREFEARSGGILCYLVLPDEIGAIRNACRAALEVHRRHRAADDNTPQTQ